jgi:hypothetical protein
VLESAPHTASYYGDDHVTTYKVMQGVIGISPELLLHLSSSVAIGFGPKFAAYAPFAGTKSWDWLLNFGPNLTYSFGPPPRNERDAKPVLPAFARRGKNVLALNVAVGSALTGSVGYLRFLTDHFAFGGHVFGGTGQAPDGLAPYWLGGGLQNIVELPLKGRWSFLLQPEIDYRYDRMARLAYSSPDPVHGIVTTHELQFTAAALPAFHLFEAFVIGAGPFVTEHVRVASSAPNLDTAYLSLGVTSMMAASF